MKKRRVRHSGNWTGSLIHRPAENFDFNTNRLRIDRGFDRKYAFSGELGYSYAKEQTTFRLWSPVAEQVELILFNGFYGKEKARVAMDVMAPATFEATLMEDVAGTPYLFELTYPNGEKKQTLDPYSNAVTVNGQRSVVVDLAKTNPEDWRGRMEPFSSPTDAIIYEMSVRDFTVSPDSGVKAKAKFTGLVEEGTKTPAGNNSGLDYLKELGVTHVQIMPLFDFRTVDEMNQWGAYNWGYDPQNYNVPDGSYATDPFNPYVRIREAKQMIQALHDAGLRVIMDVVYNHVYDVVGHPFDVTAPGYFFRYNEQGYLYNGSGCGNDTASERLMMRKYMVDSIRYWAEEFALDGFRFDLMGLHDVDTMNAIRAALDEVDPSILLLGEGWDIDTLLPAEQKANQKNAWKMERIGHFNDAIRDALKGKDFGESHELGFVTGHAFQEQWIATNMQGSAYYPQNEATYQEPSHMIQYVEAHDNFTLYDKLALVMPHDDEATRTRRHLLATSIVLLAQGIPFLHSGQEMLRTKQGVENSYNSPDAINRFDWKRRDEKQEAVDYVKGLIALRKSEPLLRLRNAESIRKHMEVLKADYYTVVLQLEDEDHLYYLLFNANGDPIRFAIESGDYELLIHGTRSYMENPEWMPDANWIEVEGFSATVIRKHK